MLVSCPELQPKSSLQREAEELGQVRRLMAKSHAARTNVGYCGAWLRFML